MSNNSNYIFNINIDAPDTGSIINFYSQFLDNSGENEYNMSNDIFFKTVFEYEKKLLTGNKSNDNNAFVSDKDIIKKAYLNMAFKIDTIHDFTGERVSSFNISKKYVMKLLGWNKENINISYSLFDTISDGINLNKTDENISNKADNSANDNVYTTTKDGFENDFLYWIIKNQVKFSSNIPKIYVSSTIENFSDIIAEQQENLSIIIDTSDERINTFKNLLLFQKFLYINKNNTVPTFVAERNNYCDILTNRRKINNTNGFSTFNENENNELNELNVMSSLIKEEKNNLNCKIIFPQLFDANTSTNKSIKWRQHVIQSMIEDNKKLSINFEIINDNCEMTYNQIDKNVLFKINNYLYPFNVIQVLNRKYTKGQLAYSSLSQTSGELIEIDKHTEYNIYKYLDKGPGVKQLLLLLQNTIDTITKDVKKILKILYDIIGILYKHLTQKNCYYSDEEIKIVLDKFRLTTNINNIKEILNVFNQLNLNKIFDNFNYDVHSYSLIFAYFELISEIKSRIKSKITSENYSIIFIEYYKEILLHNIFTIKRAGDYSQIYYCKSPEEVSRPTEYIYCSNDRLSASFCYIENVNFIGPFIDSGIFINFNEKIKFNNSIIKSSKCYGDNSKCYPYETVIKSPNINKYMKYIQLNEMEILEYYDKLYDIEYNYMKDQTEFKENEETQSNTSVNMTKEEDSSKYLKQSYMNLAFKLDTIHDFISYNFKTPIHELLWNKTEYKLDQNDLTNIQKNIKKIIQNKNMEKNFLYWIIGQNMKKKLYNNLPDITFSTSIENFTSCITSDLSKNIYFNIDVSNERINNFKNMLISSLMLKENILQNYLKLFSDTTKYKYDNIIQYYQKYNNIIITYKNTFIKYSIYALIYVQHLENLNSDEFSSDIDKKLNDLNIVNDVSQIRLLLIYIKTLYDLIDFIYIPSDFVDSIFYRIIITFYDKIKIIYKENEIMSLFSYKFVSFQNDETIDIPYLKKLIYNDDIFLNKKSKKSKLDTGITDSSIEKFEKIIIDNVDNIIKELYNDLFKYNIEDIKNIDFIEFVQDKLSTHNIKFKITPPQLLDSNSTTGKSVNIKSISLSTEIDKEGKYCKDNELYNKLEKLKLTKSFVEKLYVFIEQLNQYTNTSIPQHINDILPYNQTEFYNFLKNNNIQLDKNIVNSIELIENVRQKSPENIHKFVKKIIENLIEKYDFSKFLNINECIVNILNDKVSIVYSEYNTQIYSLEDIKHERFKTTKASQVNLNIYNLNYPIQKIKVINFNLDKTIKQHLGNLYEYVMLNELALVIIKDIEEVNQNIHNLTPETNFIINNYKKKINNVNYIHVLKSKNTIVQILNNKYFYYCEKNKTLYSMENGGPGINDLMEISNYFISLDSQNTINIYNNIFTIKRAGDYLQIDYCKKNNYIFISNDKMSASFCFLENCEFIGPFGDSGIFIQKNSEINTNLKSCKGTIKDTITYEYPVCETEPSIVPSSNILKRKRY